MQRDSKKLFSKKVDDYVKYRPKYADEFIDYFFNSLEVNSKKTIADIGAGTGILSRQLAIHGNTVFAVEPNFEMREACKLLCADSSNINVVDGSGESTTLPNHIVDYITVAQAFHWLDIEKSRKEFKRILSDNGKVILLWNWTNPESDLVKEYSGILYRYCARFSGFVDKSDLELTKYSPLFIDSDFEHKVFKNDICMSLESFLGECFSSSFAPDKGEKRYDLLRIELTNLFNLHSTKGVLVFPNNTHSFTGKV